MSISSSNVKLSIKTRAEQPSSQETSLSSSTERLESTHLCETQEVPVKKPRCRSFRQFAALQEVEEEADDCNGEVITSIKPNEGKKKAPSKSRSKENSPTEAGSTAIRDQMGLLCLNDAGVNEKRLTRSMAKNRSMTLTNLETKTKKLFD